MAEGRRRFDARAPQAAAALVIAVALWSIARAREPARATVPVRIPGFEFAPTRLWAVVEGPAGSLAALRMRPPTLRVDQARGSTVTLRMVTPEDVELPAGVRGVRVHAVLGHRPPPP